MSYLVLPVQAGVQALLSKRHDNLAKAAVELLLSIDGLGVQGLLEWAVWNRFPAVHAVTLVQRHHERSLSHFQQVDRFDGLLLQARHDVHHQNGNVAQTRTARAQVRKRLVTRGVDHQQPRDLDLQILVDVLLQLQSLLFEHFRGKVGGTNLLGDTYTFT